MINKLQKQGGRCFFKRSLMLLLMAALLIFAIPAIPAISGAEEAVSASAVAEEKKPVASDSSTAPCKGLKPYNNLDELLYQFYINLESNCLFKMPIEELEKVWGIKILSHKHVTPDKYAQLKSSTDFYGKPFNFKKDAFFLEAYHNSEKEVNLFIIMITKDYYDKHGTLFPDRNYPKLLPRPLKKYSKEEVYSENMIDRSSQGSGEYLLDVYDYYWLNSYQTSIIYLDGFNGITNIGISNKVHPDFIINSPK